LVDEGESFTASYTNGSQITSNNNNMVAIVGVNEPSIGGEWLWVFNASSQSTCYGIFQQGSNNLFEWSTLIVKLNLIKWDYISIWFSIIIIYQLIFHSLFMK